MTNLETELNNSTDVATENMMIRGLIQEKRDLEDNMQNMKQRIHSTIVEAEPINGGLSREELQHELSAAFAEVFEHIDQAQVDSLQVMSDRQNDAFQMATKHKVPSAYRNESLGLWYDAKSNVAQCIAEMKN